MSSPAQTACLAALLLLPPLMGPAAAAAPALPPDSLRLRFTEDFRPGYDAQHLWMGGTETMSLVAHRGQLYAGMSYWFDTQPDADPHPGAQVLRKDSPAAPWQVDVNFGTNYLRVEGLREIVLTTDSDGRSLSNAAVFLVASPFDHVNALEHPEGRRTVISVRDDLAGRWATTELAPRGGGARSFATHLDKVTGVHCVFAGTSGGRILRGTCQPGATRAIRWDPEPEHLGTGRVMCFAECDGALYAACGLKKAAPHDGGLYRRIDGPRAKWDLVYQWPYVEVPRLTSDEARILRGLAAVPVGSDGHSALLGTLAWPGVVERIDPRDHGKASVDLDIKAAFADIFGLATYTGPALAGYNEITPFTVPGTHETVHFIGLCVSPPQMLSPPHNGAYYLVRRQSGAYEWGYVYDPAHPVPQGRQLRATRAICVSPFPQDHGALLYFGGFDAYRGPHHNTAWIYKAELPPAPAQTRTP
jgi:hypothetical protein